MFYLIIFMFIKFTYYRLIYISKFNYEKYKKILSAYKSLIVISHELVISARILIKAAAIIWRSKQYQLTALTETFQNFQKINGGRIHYEKNSIQVIPGILWKFSEQPCHCH